MFETVGGSSLNFGSFDSFFQSGSAPNLSHPDSSAPISGKLSIRIERPMRSRLLEDPEFALVEHLHLAHMVRVGRRLVLPQLVDPPPLGRSRSWRRHPRIPRKRPQ